MHITFLALGSLGDILPCAILGQALKNRGQSATLITTGDFEGLARKFGLEFVPIRGNARETLRRVGVGNFLELARAFAKLSENLIDEFERFAPTFEKTDLILNQLALGMFGVDLAEKYAVPTMMMAVIPLLATSSFPAIGTPPGLSWLPGYNRLSYRLAYQIGWGILRKAINRWRQETLGLPLHPYLGYFERIGTGQLPVLNGFSPLVIPPPPDWGERVHTVGYWFPQEPDWNPPQALERFIETGPPPIFLGFGSIPVGNPVKTTATLLEALRLSGQRAILHTGWAGIGSHDLPENVFMIDYAPYGWLFPKMGAIIHHGGSGTTAFGLRAGVPSMTTPFLFDQQFWGDRIAFLGVGPPPLPFRKLSAVRLAEAITMMVQDGGMRQRAAALGEKIRAEDGISRAVQIILEA